MQRIGPALCLLAILWLPEKHPAPSAGSAACTVHVRVLVMASLLMRRYPVPGATDARLDDWFCTVDGAVEPRTRVSRTRRLGQLAIRQSDGRQGA
jgi:hypothetical protein